jgi:NAD(P)-dependent dehydrogenase (short-subunit alcohol dehydrogenase family)
MKILIVGGTGTLGQAVSAELKVRHTVITAARKGADIDVDIVDPQSILAMFKTAGNLDALISTAGKVHFAPFDKMNAKLYAIGLENKLMGQVNLAMHGIDYLNDAGSITLTSGILNYDPVRSGSSASMVNGAIDGFVRSAAIELPRGIRINCVSPTVVTESMPYFGEYFPGFVSVSAQTVAGAFSKSVEGAQTGQIYRVGY